MLRGAVKTLLLVGILAHLVLGSGHWPSGVRGAWQALDQATGRMTLSWGVRLLEHPATAATGRTIVELVWTSRDPIEKEVMRRYLELSGYPLERQPGIAPPLRLPQSP